MFPHFVCRQTVPAHANRARRGASGGAEGSGEYLDNQGSHAAVEALAELGGLMIRLRRRDLSLTAEAVLINLDRAGAGRVGDLAALVGVSQPTMTELLGRLGRDGLVARDTHPSDRRAVQVSISDAGSQFLRRRRQATHDALLELLAALAPDEAIALYEAVPALRAILVVASTRSAERPTKG